MSSLTRQRFICHFFFMIYGVVGPVLFPALSRSIEETFGLSHVQNSQLLGMCSAFLAVTSLGGGWLYDRLGARAIMCSALLLCAATAVWVGWGRTLGTFRVSLVAYHIAIGLAVVISPIVGQLYAGDRSRGINLLHAFQGVGRLIGPLLVGACLLVTGVWRSVFFVAAGLYVCCFFLFWWGLEGHGGPGSGAARHRSAALGPWTVIALGLLGFCFAAGVETMVVMWIPNYLESEAGFPKHEALSGLMFMMIGYTAVRVVRGTLRRQPGPRFIIPTSLLYLATLGAVLFGRGYWWIMVNCLLLGFSFGALWPSLAAMMFDYFPAGHGVLNGMISLASLAGGVSFTLLAGWVGDRHGLRLGMLWLCPVAAVINTFLYCRFYALLERRRQSAAAHSPAPAGELQPAEQ